MEISLLRTRPEPPCSQLQDKPKISRFGVHMRKLRSFECLGFTPRGAYVEWVTIGWNGCPSSAPCMHHACVRGGSNGVSLAAKTGSACGVSEYRSLRYRCSNERNIAGRVPQASKRAMNEMRYSFSILELAHHGRPAILVLQALGCIHLHLDATVRHERKFAAN
jgi:hypothetical protein